MILTNFGVVWLKMYLFYVIPLGIELIAFSMVWPRSFDYCNFINCWPALQHCCNHFSMLTLPLSQAHSHYTYSQFFHFTIIWEHFHLRICMHNNIELIGANWIWISHFRADRKKIEPVDSIRARDNKYRFENFKLDHWI